MLNWPFGQVLDSLLLNALRLLYVRYVDLIVWSYDGIELISVMADVQGLQDSKESVDYEAHGYHNDRCILFLLDLLSDPSLGLFGPG